MIDKYVVDPQKDLREEVIGLAQKLNELIEVVSSQANLVLRRPIHLASKQPDKEPGPAQYVEYMVEMVQQLQAGPYKLLVSKTAPASDLLKTVGETLKAFQDAVLTFQKSLAGN